ncbi:MAG: hypothetical protein SNJ52_04890, partial [Verrucomicrobiia bacterium]
MHNLRLEGEPRWHAVCQAILVFLALCAVAILFTTKPPWKTGLYERLAKGQNPRLEQLVAEGIWFTACLKLVLLVTLFATSRHWMKPVNRAPRQMTAGRAFLHTRSPARTLFLLALSVAMAWGAIERIPKLGQSFGNDEEFAFRRLIHGQFHEKDGALEFEARSWQETLFSNRASNNHILFTVLARLSHETALLLGLGGEDTINEAAVRIPSLIAGLLSIPLIGVLLARCGFASAGAAAAFLLALNPWHLRYATEARGYAVMLFCILAALLALIIALDTGQRRAWWGFALAQACYMLAFPGALHLAAAMNASVLLVVWINRKALDPGQTLLHWVVASLGSALLFLMLFAPSARQLVLFMDQRAATGAMGWPWWRDLWSHLATGMRWHQDDAKNPLFLSIQHSLEAHPIAELLFLILLPIALAAGVLRTACHRGPTLLLVLPTLVAAGLAFTHIGASGRFLYAWYVLYVVIGFCIGVALGVDWIGSIRMPWLPHSAVVMRGLALGVTGFFLAAYAWHTAYPRNAMAAHPRHPIREAVQAAHGEGLSPFSIGERSLITAAIGTSSRQKQTYDPRVVPLELNDEQALPLIESLKTAAEERVVPLRVLV